MAAVVAAVVAGLESVVSVAVFEAVVTLGLNVENELDTDKPVVVVVAAAAVVVVGLNVADKELVKVVVAAVEGGLIILFEAGTENSELFAGRVDAFAAAVVVVVVVVAVAAIGAAFVNDVVVAVFVVVVGEDTLSEADVSGAALAPVGFSAASSLVVSDNLLVKTKGLFGGKVGFLAKDKLRLE